MFVVALPLYAYNMTRALVWGLKIHGPLGARIILAPQDRGVYGVNPFVTLNIYLPTQYVIFCTYKIFVWTDKLSCLLIESVFCKSPSAVPGKPT